MIPPKRIFLLSALFALLLALVTVKKARSLESPDFKVFYTAARHALVDPENIYRLSPDRYLYPPSTAILLTPFAFTENYSAHQWQWHGLLAAMLFLLCSVSSAALAATVLLVRYLAITFSYGQINLVVIGLLAGVGWLGEKGRWSVSGALWAMATSLKVYPAVLAPLFLPRSRWLGLAGAFLCGLFLLALPFVVFGFSLGGQLYREFFGALEAKGLPLHSHNQSIAAFLLRVFTAQEFYLHAVGPARWGVLDLSPAFLRGAALCLGAGLAALSWLRAGRAGFSGQSALSAASFSVLFLSHIVWKDYLLFLYFPLREIFGRLPKRQRWLVGGAFLALVTFSSPDIVGHPLSTRLDAACIHLWAAGLVWWAWHKA
jgi:hypothetical protein